MLMGNGLRFTRDTSVHRSRSWMEEKAQVDEEGGRFIPNGKSDHVRCVIEVDAQPG